jgi:hypothetical protein
LRVFGCLCFPNTSSTTANKLSPRSLPCIYLGPSDDHKGSRCFDPSSGHVLISRHVTFDENTFPFSTVQSPTTHTPNIYISFHITSYFCSHRPSYRGTRTCLKLCRGKQIFCREPAAACREPAAACLASFSCRGSIPT